MRAGETRTRSRRVIIACVKLLLLAGVLWFVGRAMLSAAGKVDWGELGFRPAWILLGAAGVLGGIFVGGWVLCVMYSRLSSPLKLREGFSLFTVPILGKYVPGRVVSIAGHAAVAKSFGVPLSTSGPGVLLLFGLGLSTATLVGLAFLIVQPVGGIDAATFRLSLAAAAAVLAVLMYPRLYFGLVNLVLRLMKRRPLEVRLRPGTMAMLAGGMCIHALLYTGGFVALCKGVVDIPPTALPMMIGAMCIANTVGLLAIFAPGGIGVREGVLLAVLTPTLGAGMTLLATVALRLLQVVADVALTGAGLVIMRRENAPKR